MMYDHITEFDQVLRENSPEASNEALRLARNSFLRVYGSYSVAPEIALAIATDDELLRIRHAGKKCQQIYLNARSKLREKFAAPIADILKLKRSFYEEANDAHSAFLGGIDRMTLQCIECGIRSKKRFDLIAGRILAYPGKFLWDGDETIVERAFCKITKELHPKVFNPQTYIVRYRGEDKEIIYVGVDPVKGRDKLLRKLSDDGYKASVSGRINGLPIRFINCEKIQEVKDGPVA